MDIAAPVCRTCAVQYPPDEAPPAVCAVCADERQWVPAEGQRWTSLGALRAEGYRGELRDAEPGLVGVGVTPSLGIGQRALLVRTGAGNVLWDCVGYLDDELVAAVGERGGVAHIAASHPHFYGAMVEWAHAFGARLWLPEADRRWVLRADADIVWWGDEAEPVPGVHLVRCAGHFDGSAVLHWTTGTGGRGAVLVGDTASVAADRRHVAFMRSYPNHLPLPPAAVRRIVAGLSRHPFDRVYGGWWDRVIAEGGQAAVERSAARHIAWVTG